jgi:KRAB domain-containing zinc finger protein
MVNPVVAPAVIGLKPPVKLTMPPVVKKPMERVPVGKNTKCYMCNVIVTDLRKHTAKAHPKAPFYMCPEKGCGYKSPYRHRVRLHNSTVHHQFKEFPCPHNGCKYKGAQKSDVTRHIAKHSTDKPFPCFCGKRFKRKLSLNAHTKHEHGALYSKTNPFKCPVCAKRYVTRSFLITHIDQTHI